MLEVCIASMKASDRYCKGLRIILKYYRRGRMELMCEETRKLVRVRLIKGAAEDVRVAA